MNREIKFRAWDKNLQRMFHHRPKGGVFVISEYGWELGQPDYDWGVIGASEKDNGILMQFTGVKDPTGIEIFEGDILECNSGIHLAPSRHEVIFINGSFYISFDVDHGITISALPRIGMDFKVIGNIYEHSELIK